MHLLVLNIKKAFGFGSIFNRAKGSRLQLKSTFTLIKEQEMGRETWLTLKTS
jgi:hypothetical protein